MQLHKSTRNMPEAILRLNLNAVVVRSVVFVVVVVVVVVDVGAKVENIKQKVR